MAKTLSGLFTGPSAADVRMAMGLESDARIRQAGVDAKAGGFIPSYIARARQKGVEALQPLMGAGIQAFGGEVPQDPRLAKALKRDKDKKEIMAILEGYHKSDGIIDEDEIEKGWSLLMSRGYQDEAKEFRLRAEGILKNKNALKGQTTKAIGSGLPIYLTAEEAKRAGLPEKATYAFQDRIMGRDGQLKTVYTPTIGTPTSISKRNDPDTLKKAEAQQTGREIPKRETIKYEEKLKRKTLEIKKNFNIEEARAINFAKKDLNTSEEFMRAGAMAKSEKETAIQLLKLSKEVQSGRINAAITYLKNTFNIDAKDDAEFRTGVQMLLVQNLKKIMGARPTDKDLEELAKAMAGMSQTNEANIAILQRFVNQMDKEIKYGMWFVNNPTGKFTDFYREQMQPPPEDYHIKFLRQNKNSNTVKKDFENRFGKKALKKALENNDGE